jgi:pimeloyl-ACP methyl ester carboxylesterase
MLHGPAAQKMQGRLPKAMRDKKDSRSSYHDALLRTRAIPKRLRALRAELLTRPPVERVATGSLDWVYHRQGSGPPLILIHGLSGSVAWWRHNIGVLAEHFTVYAVELRGFAGNRRGRPLPLRESADGLRDFMDALEIEAADVIGHSMGGQISLHLAARSPEHVRRLVVVAPSGLLRRGLVPMAFRLARAPRYSAPDFAPILLLDALRAGPINLWLAARELLRDDVEELLEKIAAPTLVVAGEHDMLVPVEVCKAVADGIQGVRFEVVHGAGHNVMYDRPQAFNQVVLDFLTEAAPEIASPEGALIGGTTN